MQFWMLTRSPKLSRLLHQMAALMCFQFTTTIPFGMWTEKNMTNLNRRLSISSNSLVGRSKAPEFRLEVRMLDILRINRELEHAKLCQQWNNLNFKRPQVAFHNQRKLINRTTMTLICNVLQHFLAICPKFLKTVILVYVFKVGFHGFVCTTGMCDVFHVFSAFNKQQMVDAGVICSHWLLVLSSCWKKKLIFPFSYVFWWWIPCSSKMDTEMMPSNDSNFWCMMGILK